MKRLIFLFSAIAFFAGCDKLDEVSKPTHKPTQEGGVPEIVYATVADEDEEDSKTRTYVDEENYVLWHKGDAISYFTRTSHNYKYTNSEADGATKATFELATDGYSSTNVEGTYAIYPYSANNSYSDNKFNVTYPATQTYAENSFGKGANLMLATSAKSDDTDLYFYNACGYLIIKLYGEGIYVKNITLSPVSDNDIIAGTADITMNIDAAPTINMSEDTPVNVTLDCSQHNNGAGVALGATAEQATEFWFVLPPVTFTGGFEITVTSMDDEVFEKKTTKEFTIERNQIKPMAALEFRSSTHKAYELFYTTSDGQAINFSHLDSDEKPFNATITSNTYDNGMGIITFRQAPTSINEKAFYEKDNLTSVTMPEGISFIGENAFARTGLTELTIPGSVTKIDVDAFYRCTALKKLTFLPSPNKTPLKIGHGIDSSTKHISPFYYSPLEEIYLDRTFDYLIDKNGDKYEYETNSDGDEVPLGIFMLAAVDGYETDKLRKVTLGSQVTKLNKYMFIHTACPEFTTITIPGTVKEIEEYAFWKCVSLTTVNLESGIEKIGRGAFHSTTAIKEINIPSSVTDIGDYAFFGNTNLTSVIMNEGVKRIGSYAFTYNDNLTQITIPDSVEEIGNFAFATLYDIYDSNLRSVNLGNGVKTLGEGVFYGCKSLTSISIPANVTKIGINTFYGCTSLNTVIIEEGDSSLRIGGLWHSDKTYDLGPFFDSPLSDITVLRNMQIIDDEGQDSSTTDANGMFNLSSNAPSNTNVTLGGKLTMINEYMFRSLNITSISIPASVTTIGNFAFYYCEDLTSVTFEEGDTDLVIGFQDHSDEKGPFYDSPLETVRVYRNLVLSADYSASCNQTDEGIFSQGTPTLKTVTLGNQVKQLPKRMFQSAKALTSITIPASVTKIEDFVFDDCTALTSVTFEEGDTDLVIGFQPHTDERGPFFDSPLRTINLKRNLVLSAEYKNAQDEWDEGIFAYTYWNHNVNWYTELKIGAQVKQISDYMFSGVRVTAFWIPQEVKSIGYKAFHDCEQLVEVTLGHSTPPTLGSEAFDDCNNLKNIVLPYSTIDTFKNHENWKGWKPYENKLCQSGNGN